MLTSVYVHFPWCLKKCPYCDFASVGVKAVEIPQVAYTDAVLRELSARAVGGVEGRTLCGIFFGGGTPSLWEPEELGRVVSAIKTRFTDQVPDLEVSIECNPTSLDADRARRFAGAGVNRLSIGMQSLDEEHLRFLGRLHDAPLALESARHACAAVDRVSADFMFGMPGQVAEDPVSDLSAVIETGISHISAYALTIESQTQFGALARKGRLALAPDETYAETFLRVESHLQSRGFEHYEVSNYARPGEACRHNLHYWRGGDYLGLGAGAVGCLSLQGCGGGENQARRYRNTPKQDAYLNLPSCAEAETELLKAQDRIRETLMLGLRTKDGVDLKALAERVGEDPLRGRIRALERHQGLGNVLLEEGVLTIPTSRWLHLDSIVCDLF